MASSTSTEDWTAFRKTFTGRVLTNDDPDYESARKAWNGELDKRPLAIVMPLTNDDIAKAILFARGKKIPLTARCGGHSLRCVIDDGIVIDLRKMRQVTVDVEKKVAVVQGGCILSDLDKAAWQHKLATPAGQVSHTGVAGLALGGGFGYISRKFGLTCDNILEVKMVLASGESITVNKDTNAELYWAVRGAGHNFGIVYEFTFQLFDMPHFSAATIVHKFTPEVAKEAIKFVRHFITTVSDNLGCYFVLAGDPQLGLVIAISVPYVGTVEELTKEAAPLLSWGSPVVAVVESAEYPAYQSKIDHTLPHGSMIYNWDGFMNQLDDAAVDLVVEHFAKAPQPSFVALIALGGAVARTSPVTGDNCCAQKDKPWLSAIASLYPPNEPKRREESIAWGRATRFITSDYVNSINNLRTLEKAYGSNVGRLVEIKKKYDPENVFQHNHNLLNLKE